MFTFIYLLLFILFIYLLNKKIQHGPDASEMVQHRPGQEQMASLASAALSNPSHNDRTSEPLNPEPPNLQTPKP